MAHLAIKLKAEGFDDACTQALIHIATVATEAGLNPGKDFEMPPDLLALFNTLPLCVANSNDELTTFRRGVGISFRACVQTVDKQSPL